MSSRHLKKLRKLKYQQDVVDHSKPNYNGSDSSPTDGDNDDDDEIMVAPAVNAFDLLTMDNEDGSNSTEDDKESIIASSIESSQKDAKSSKSSSLNQPQQLLQKNESQDQQQQQEVDNDLDLLEQFAKSHSVKGQVNDSDSQNQDIDAMSQWQKVFKSHQPQQSSANRQGKQRSGKWQIQKCQFLSNAECNGYPVMSVLQKHLELQFDDERCVYYLSVDPQKHKESLSVTKLCIHALMLNNVQIIEELSFTEQGGALQPFVIHSKMIMALSRQSSGVQQQIDLDSLTRQVGKVVYLYERLFSLSKTWRGGSSLKLSFFDYHSRIYLQSLFLRSYIQMRQGHLEESLRILKYCMDIQMPLKMIASIQLTDDLAVLCLIDTVAYRCEDYDFLNQLYDALSADQEGFQIIIFKYPHLVYSFALSYLTQLSTLQSGRKDKNVQRDTLMSKLKYVGALVRGSIYIAPRIVDKLNLRLSPSEVSICQQLPSIDEYHNVLADLYVHYASSLWNRPFDKVLSIDGEYFDTPLSWLRLQISLASDLEPTDGTITLEDRSSLNRHLVLMDLVDSTPIPNALYSHLYYPKFLPNGNLGDSQRPTNKTKGWNSMLLSVDNSIYVHDVNYWGMQLAQSNDPYPPAQCMLHTSNAESVWSIHPYAGIYRSIAINKYPQILLPELYKVFGQQQRQFSKFSQYVASLGVDERDVMNDELKRLLFHSDDQVTSGSQGYNFAQTILSMSSVVGSFLSSLLPVQNLNLAGISLQGDDDAYKMALQQNDRYRAFICNQLIQ
ncbi:hypothetical protein MIR68_001547 [Amoeboaphelidium protococcarum]|nr:hypothetical protein MIR68_001547 [Amoeboaphelidium protococcarum]